MIPPSVSTDGKQYTTGQATPEPPATFCPMMPEQLPLACVERRTHIFPEALLQGDHDNSDEVADSIWIEADVLRYS
jgi:hypothetical protein